MKYISMVCPNCGANLENIDSELKQCYCQYCGTKIAIDDGTKVTKNYNYDEAAIIRAQTEQKIKLQEMKQQEEDLKQLKKNKKMYYKILICAIAASLVVDFFVWIFAGTKKKIGKIEGFCMVTLYAAYTVYIIIR